MPSCTALLGIKCRYRYRSKHNREKGDEHTYDRDSDVSLHLQLTSVINEENGPHEGHDNDRTQEMP